MCGSGFHVWLCCWKLVASKWAIHCYPLPMSTAVSQVVFSLPSVCFSWWYVKSCCTNLDIQMFHDESWKPIYFGIKRSRSQRLYLSSDRTQYWLHCCVYKLCWVFSAVMPHHTSSASDTGFSPCVTSPHLLATGRRVFSGTGFCTLASSGFLFAVCVDLLWLWVSCHVSWPYSIK